MPSTSLVRRPAALALVAVGATLLLFAAGCGGGDDSGGMMQAGPGMMGGDRGGMMGGYGSTTTSERPSASALGSIRGKVESWLRSRGYGGFRVSEVMAFSNNDYVAVRDAKGKSAFELLTTPSLSWLMEEPPSMMWNTRYGMMHGYGRSWSGMGSMMGGGMMDDGMMGGWNGWYGSGQSNVSSVAEAVRIADRWLARTGRGERVENDVHGMGHFPGYYTLDTTRKGKTVGMLSINASTGSVWYHVWHGRFLAEREF